MAWEPGSLSAEQRLACTELLVALQSRLTEELHIVDPESPAHSETAWYLVSRHCWRLTMAALSDAQDAMWKVQPPAPGGNIR